jgi:hypothetical protein
MPLRLVRPRALLAAALLAVGAVAAPACARNQPRQVEDVGAIMLFIDNRGWDDMNVFVLRGDTRDRLGRVSAASRWSVPLDRWVNNQAGNIRIVAQPVGTRYYGNGASAVTQILQLESGQTVLWTIEKDLARSFVEIR